MLIGIVFIDSESFGTDKTIYSIFYVDNYYLYVFLSLSTAIIEVVMIFAGLFQIILKIFKDKSNELVSHKLMNSIIITQLYTGLFEKCVINYFF